MTLIGDLQAAEPTTVTPAHFDTWVRATHVDLEALLTTPPAKTVLDTTIIPSDWDSTTDPLTKLSVPGATLSFTVPDSGLFYVHFGFVRGGFYVRNAFGWVQLLDQLNAVVTETIFAISLVEYGAEPYYNDETVTSKSTGSGTELLMLGQYTPGAQLDASIVLAGTNVHQNTDYSVTTYYASYDMQTNAFMTAYAL